MAMLINPEPPRGDVVKDGDTESFAADVLQASQDGPVIVDFWAPWCGPCKQLTPALEKAVQEQRGAVTLVKIDVDQNQQLAAQLRIQSIPTVMAFFKGRPVDGFQGAMPESQVKAFVKRLADEAGGGDSPLEAAAEQAAQLVAAGQHDQAIALYQQILQAQPDYAPAVGGMISCLVAEGRLDEAEQALNSLPADMRDPAIDRARAALDLARQSAGSGDVAALQAKLASDPDDHQARFDLAVALAAAGQREAAAEELLEILRRDRSWNEEAARKQLVKLFEAAGPSDPFTVKTRRKLSALLFA